MVDGANSVLGLIADPCNCQNYVQCEYNSTLAQFTGIVRACNPCEIWDQTLLTCIRNDAVPECVFQPTTEETGLTYL